MSGFNCEVLEKKLNELTNTQQSIQTLSLWLIHHRKHSKIIVKTWYKELKKVKPSKRLTFMYLANDVIQNSRKKGAEFTKEFVSALKHAFDFVGRDADDKMIQSLERIISIWSQRNIYELSLLDDFKKSLKNSNELASLNQLVDKVKKRKEGDEGNSPTKKIKPILLSQSDVALPVNGKEVDSGELINCLKSLENTASCDATVRERIAKLPPELSDTSYIDKLKDKTEAEQLGRRVNEACDILNDYNGRLAKELEDRKKISYKLAAYLRYQKEIQEKTHKQLSECIDRLNKIKRVKNELELHLKNLPDLDQLPSLQEAPLPKPGDLFVSTKKDENPDETNSDKVTEQEQLAENSQSV